MNYEDWCGQKIDSLEYEVEQLTKALEEYKDKERTWRGEIASCRDLEGQVVQMGCEALDLIYDNGMSVESAISAAILGNPSVTANTHNQLAILDVSSFADYGREHNLIDFDVPIHNVIEQCALWAVDAEVTEWVNSYLEGVEAGIYVRGEE